MEENIEVPNQQIIEESNNSPLGLRIESNENIKELKLENENLKKELEKLRQENKRLQDLEDQFSEKDKEIKLLQIEITELKKEKKQLQESLNNSHPTNEYSPVLSPLNNALYSSLVDKSVIKTKEIEQLMKSIDRADFAPHNSYLDGAQSIGFNTTISAPHMHASQLEYLKDKLVGAKKALDIGTGSGMFALCMAKLMKTEGAVVYAVDHIKKILQLANDNISKNHKEYIDSGKIQFIQADGRNGVEEHAPYDVIFLGAVLAIDEIPEVIFDQLAEGGVLLAPVGHHEQNLTIYHKTPNGILSKPIVRVMFGKLQNAKDQYPLDEE